MSRTYEKIGPIELLVNKILWDGWLPNKSKYLIECETEKGIVAIWGDKRKGGMDNVNFFHDQGQAPFKIYSELLIPKNSGSHHTYWIHQYVTKISLPFSIFVSDLYSDNLISAEEFKILKNWNNAPELIIKAVFRVDGESWVFHQNDSDPFPSNPHGHNYDRNQVLNPFTGEIFDKNNLNEPKRRLGKKQFRQIWDDQNFQKFFKKIRSLQESPNESVTIMTELLVMGYESI